MCKSAPRSKLGELKQTVKESTATAQQEEWAESKDKFQPDRLQTAFAVAVHRK